MIGNKGMLLESIINKTLNIYKQNGVAIIHKKEVPIKFSSIKIKNNKLEAKDAFISKKSTVDYYGIYAGHFLAFEAKSSKGKAWSINNIHPHQIEYLKQIKKHGGISFIILGFIAYTKFFYIDIDQLEKLEKKSISLDDALKKYTELELVYPGILDFLSLI